MEDAGSHNHQFRYCCNGSKIWFEGPGRWKALDCGQGWFCDVVGPKSDVVGRKYGECPQDSWKSGYVVVLVGYWKIEMNFERKFEKWWQEQTLLNLIGPGVGTGFGSELIQT